jgi:hypothetical protein
VPTDVTLHAWDFDRDRLEYVDDAGRLRSVGLFAHHDKPRLAAVRFF